MKKIILTIILLIGIGAASFAQCGKTVVLTSSKTDHLDAAGKINHSFDEKVVIEISKTSIDISVNGDHKMKGTVTSTTCNWKVPIKTGKTVVNALMTLDGGKKAVMTIEGKKGKIIVNFAITGQPDDKVRITADKFEAKA